MAKSLSAATKLKIARSLKGNKNAFRGGPKKSGLSTRQKIANINAATKAKKANLSSDQIARRQAVAKRLRAQARREEALGGGQATKMVTNEQNLANAREQATRKAIKELEQITGKGVPKRADNAAYEAMKKSAQRNPTPAKAQPKAKQNLNAPQSPPEQRAAALSPLQRRRQQSSKFEANQAKARQAERLLNQQKQQQLQEDAAFDIQKKRQGGATEFARQQGAQVVDVPISGRGSRGGGLKADPIATSKAMRELQGITGKGVPKRADNAAYEKAMGVNNKQDKPRSPQSDTGSDRSGTFTKKVPVKGEKSTRANGRKAIETEEDLQDFIAERTPDIIRKLAKGIPQSDLRDLKAMIGKEMGAEGLDALNDILKR